MDKTIWMVRLMDTDKNGNRIFINFETQSEITPDMDMAGIKEMLGQDGFITGHKLWTRPTDDPSVLEVFKASEIAISEKAIFSIEPAAKTYIRKDLEECRHAD